MRSSTTSFGKTTNRMKYSDRLNRYEAEKAGIAQMNLNPKEYEQRLRDAARKWRI